MVSPKGFKPSWPFLTGLMNGPVERFHQIGQIALDTQATGTVKVAKGQVGVGDQRVKSFWISEVQGKPGRLLMGLNHVVVP